jgi:hypothetical protein
MFNPAIGIHAPTQPESTIMIVPPLPTCVLFEF